MEIKYHYFNTFTKNDWLEVFNSDILTEEFWEIVKILYSTENHKLNAKCIAEILGINHFIVLNRLVGSVGHKIFDMFKIKNPPFRENNTIRWWNIVFDGEDLYSKGSMICYWILKKEMLSAIEESSIINKDISKKIEEKSKDLYPLIELYNGISDLEGKERKAVLSVRQNQSKIRKLALQKYNGKCAICGLKIPSLLIASHIKPWACSTPREKGDLNNILLLCPNHNALFDKFLITFLDDGTIKINDKIRYEDRTRLGIDDNIKIDIDKEAKDYLAFHREEFCKK